LDRVSTFAFGRFWTTISDVSRFVDYSFETSSDDAHNRIWYAYASHDPLSIEKGMLLVLGLFSCFAAPSSPMIISRGSPQQVPRYNGDHYGNYYIPTGTTSRKSVTTAGNRGAVSHQRWYHHYVYIHSHLILADPCSIIRSLSQSR